MDLYRRPRSPFWWATHAGPGIPRLRWSTGAYAQGPLKKLEREARAIAEAQLATRVAQAEGRVKCRSIREALDDYVARLTSGGAASAKGQGALRDKSLGLGAFAGRWHLDGTRDLATLSSRDCEALVVARRAEGNGPQTIAHELKLWRAATRDAASLGYEVPRDLVDGSVRRAWRMPKVPQKTRYLSPEEWGRVWAALDPARHVGSGSSAYALTGQRRASAEDVQSLFLALTITGGRWSEVKAMRWDDLDLVGGTVRLYGTKDQEGRVAPLAAPLRIALEKRAAADGRHETLVFPGKDGKPRASSCRAITRAMARCGLNDPDLVSRYGAATVHSLRHTFASLSVQAGEGLYQVQQALGHANGATTQRYAHLAHAASARRLGAAVEGALMPEVLKNTPSEHNQPPREGTQ